MNSARYLAMFGADTQIRTRGAVSSSATNVSRDGAVEATSQLFQRFLQGWLERPARVISETDDLNVVALAKVVYQQLAGHPELAEPSSDIAVLQQRLTTLRELRARKHSRLSRDVDGFVDEAIAPVVGRLKKALEEAVADTPHCSKQVVAQVRSVISHISLSEPNSDSIARLGRIIRALSDFSQRRLSIPKKSLDFAFARLTESALPEYNAAVAALVDERVTDALKQEFQRLDVYLKELIQRQALLSKNLALARDKMERWRVASLRDGHVSKVSVVVELEGTTSSEIIAGMMVRWHCKDQQQLSVEIGTRWEAKLRESAAAWLQDDPPLGVLLTHLDPEVIAESFRQTVEESFGEGHSLYEIVERTGVTRIASELLDRAEPLCDLQSRDIEQFNITPYQVTIVRVPPVVGPRDTQIRDQLEAAFVKLTHGQCEFLAAAPSERHTLTVVRSIVGWPIAIEGGNPALLLEYSRACHAGHLPHLIGVTEGTKHGEGVAAYLQLAGSLHPHFATQK